MKPNVTGNRRRPAPAPQVEAVEEDPVAVAAIVGDVLAPLERLGALLEGGALERLPADTFGALEEIRDDLEAAVAGFEPSKEEGE